MTALGDSLYAPVHPASMPLRLTIASLGAGFAALPQIMEWSAPLPEPASMRQTGDSSQLDKAERTMKKHNENREAKVMGIDLAKSSFHVHGEDADGRKAISKKFSRQKLKEYLVNLPQCTVAMEACAGAHYWARQLHLYGHEVRLIAPQFVKPYVKSKWVAVATD